MMLLAYDPDELIGWFSAALVSLILFQLGLLLPATHFSHGGCLQVTNPLGVNLHILQDAVFALGSVLQSWVIAAFNLFFVGCATIAVLFLTFMVTLMADMMCCSGFERDVRKIFGNETFAGFLFTVCVLPPCLWVVWGIVIFVWGSLVGCEAFLTSMLLWIDGADESTVLRGFVLAMDVVVKFLAVAALLDWPFYASQLQQILPPRGQGNADTIGRAYT